MIVLDLVHNIALLVSLSVLFDILSSEASGKKWWNFLVTGLLFGGVAIIGMMTPLRFTEGVIYDGRSIILTVAGLFTGPASAAVAGAAAAAYRAWLGGAGAVAGVLVIAESVLFGSLFYILRRRSERWVSFPALLVLSVVVHVSMLLLQLLIPGGVGIRVITTIGPAILVFYSVGLVLISRLFLDREQKRRTDLQLFLTQHAVDQASIEIYRVREADSRIMAPNRQLCADLGYTRQELSEMSLADIDPTFTREKWEEQKRLARGGTRSLFETIHRRKDGSEYPVEVITDFVTFLGEHFTFSFARDISEEKRHREELGRSLEEKEILLREIHHRVRNNFAVISSLISLQMEAVRTPEDAVAALEKMRDRINAMNQVHSMLYRTASVSLIDMRSYLQELTLTLFEAYRGERELKLLTDLEVLMLDMDRAIPVGLIVSEAVTNILKHAYPGSANGDVSIAMKRIAFDRTEIEVRDFGKGFAAEKEAGPRSLGLRLIQVLAAQAQASVTIDSAGGTRVRILLENVPERALE